MVNSNHDAKTFYFQWWCYTLCLPSCIVCITTWHLWIWPRSIPQRTTCFCSSESSSLALYFRYVFSVFRSAAGQMEQTDDASRVETEYPHLILHADIPFARLTHRQFVPFARPFCDLKSRIHHSNYNFLLKRSCSRSSWVASSGFLCCCLQWVAWLSTLTLAVQVMKPPKEQTKRQSQASAERLAHFLS